MSVCSMRSIFVFAGKLVMQIGLMRPRKNIYCWNWISKKICRASCKNRMCQRSCQEKFNIYGTFHESMAARDPSFFKESKDDDVFFQCSFLLYISIFHSLIGTTPFGIISRYQFVHSKKIAFHNGLRNHFTENENVSLEASRNAPDGE